MRERARDWSLRAPGNWSQRNPATRRGRGRDRATRSGIDVRMAFALVLVRRTVLPERVVTGSLSAGGSCQFSLQLEFTPLVYHHDRVAGQYPSCLQRHGERQEGENRSCAGPIPSGRVFWPGLNTGRARFRNFFCPHGCRFSRRSSSPCGALLSLAAQEIAGGIPNRTLLAVMTRPLARARTAHNLPRAGVSRQPPAFSCSTILP